MDQSAIFAPMGALALLTYVALLLIPFRRFRAAGQGAVTVEDFRFGESARAPSQVSIPNRNYMNLLEIPTLFYPVCLMFYVTQRVDGTVLAVAWGFVLLRVIHSAVHLTYNNVFHRLAAFALGNLTLGVLWTLFFVRAA